MDGWQNRIFAGKKNILTKANNIILLNTNKDPNSAVTTKGNGQAKSCCSMKMHACIPVGKTRH